ncbi:MAG: V-type ATP synthase subunit D, partial [Candidatus Micrarchaeota archaeon]|nr:V-type ATP synthase subunit D [Candidatus Micrarchaeota archaeon]
MEAVRPTRMELLNTRQKLVLARKGYDLLKKKRDALVLELFATIRKAKDVRSQVNKQVIDAHKKLAVARAVHGDLFVEANALAARTAPEVEVNAKNIMGVKIPEITATKISRNIFERGYSVHGSSAKFDEAVEAFENSLNQIIELAETETALRRLIKEIERTNRRVNALEYIVQPELEST